MIVFFFVLFVNVNFILFLYFDVSFASTYASIFVSAFSFVLYIFVSMFII